MTYYTIICSYYTKYGESLRSQTIGVETEHPYAILEMLNEFTGYTVKFNRHPKRASKNPSTKTFAIYSDA